jgi:citrate lyase subunit beta / citryl-CoA lyase
MADIKPRRSVLYVPADRPRAIAKARALPMDSVVIDLEDSIAPEGKAAARESMRTALQEPFGCELVIRINALDTEWATEDILAAVSVDADAILATKVNGPGEIRDIARSLSHADALEGTAIWTMIETPKALLHVQAIAALADEPDVPLAALVLGTNDLSLATRVPVEERRAAFIPWFMQVVAAARAFDLDVLDGVRNDYRDLGRLEEECRQSRSLGIDGKTLIHPSQVDIANRLFRPAPEEIADAEKVVAAFGLPENAGKGVIGIEGRMVERLHLLAAERTLALAAAIAEQESM